MDQVNNGPQDALALLDQILSRFVMQSAAEYAQLRAALKSKLVEQSATSSTLQQQVDELTRQRDALRAALDHDAAATVEDRNFRNKWFNEGYTTALRDRRAAMTVNDAELDAQLFASNKR